MQENILTTIIFLLCVNNFTSAQTIIINEIMSSNRHTLSDLDGDYEDWIELYNYGNQVVDLHGLSLSDDNNDWDKWQFPHVIISPNEYVIIFASGKNIWTVNEVHTNFKIKQSGEALFLSNAGQLISSMPSVFIPTDESYGVHPDFQFEYAVFEKSTPKNSNIILNHILPSHHSGFYQKEFLLELTADDSSQKMYYTLNGAIPTPNSFEYGEPILIKNNTNTPNNFSDIPTTPLIGPSRLNKYIWKKPPNIYKSNVIRYASYDGNQITSPIYSQTYFVDSMMKDRYDYPIVSIITDSLNLFDYEKGIYIPGKRFDEQGFDAYPNGNYKYKGKDWERSAYVSYFENDGEVVFETNVGMRMRGIGSTAFPQKAFTLFFRDEYGLKDIDEPIFHNSDITGYKRLVFRNSGSDFLDTHFKDALLQSLLEPLDLELQNFKPSIVFINGEYWGIHNMREKYDEYYIRNHFDIDKDDVNIVKWCGEVEAGSNEDYISLMNYVYGNDLSENIHYQYIESQVDITNYIDFQIAEIYYGNYDWPCNNYKMWKTNADTSKWRFLIYDLDLSFAFSENTMFDRLGMEHATKIDNSWPYCECSNIMFVKLLENESFKELFVSRFEKHLSTIFDVERVLEAINKFSQIFGNEMPEHINRWSYPSSLKAWEENIEVLREFAINRPCYIKNDLINFFDLTDLNYACPDSSSFFPESKLAIAPNPNIGYFHLRSSLNGIFDGEVTVRNVYGQVVYYEENVVLYTYGRRYFDLQNLASGTYFISFDYNEKTEVQKIVIVR
jgi:hypothetical protein